MGECRCVPSGVRAGTAAARWARRRDRGASDRDDCWAMAAGRRRRLRDRGGRAERLVGQSDRGARSGDPEQGRGRRGQLGVVRPAGYLRGRRVLPGRRPPLAGVRGRGEERPVAPGDRGARPGDPEQGRERRGQLGVVHLAGRLRGRRVLPGRRRSSAGVRGDGAARPVAPGDRGAWPGDPEHGRGRRRHLGVVRLGGRLRGRRVLPGRRPPSPGVRGRREERLAGAGRSRCPAWRP